MVSRRAVLAVVGPRGSGKTTLLAGAAEILKGRGRAVGGVLAPSYFEGEKRAGRDLLPLSGPDAGRLLPLARLGPFADGPAVGRFHLSAEALRAAEAALDAARGCEIVMADEFGPLEARGEGLYFGLKRVAESEGALIVALRPWPWALKAAGAAKGKGRPLSAEELADLVEIILDGS